MITKEMLKKLAGKLMFNMNDEEYDTLVREFEIMTKQMELINEIEGITQVEPLVFPYEMDIELRKDDEVRNITIEEAFKNASSVKGREIKVPKVVE